jgi:hypothetical protein
MPEFIESIDEALTTTACPICGSELVRVCETQSAGGDHGAYVLAACGSGSTTYAWQAYGANSQRGGPRAPLRAILDRIAPWCDESKGDFDRLAVLWDTLAERGLLDEPFDPKP